MKKIKKALISVSEKKELRLLLKNLSKYKIELISSGGTYKEIKKLGFKCTEISKYTGFSEILDGRVKTLHPKIHAGILNKREKKARSGVTLLFCDTAIKPENPIIKTIGTITINEITRLFFNTLLFFAA